MREREREREREEKVFPTRYLWQRVIRTVGRSSVMHVNEPGAYS